MSMEPVVELTPGDRWGWWLTMTMMPTAAEMEHAAVTDGLVPIGIETGKFAWRLTERGAERTAARWIRRERRIGERRREQREVRA